MRSIYARNRKLTFLAISVVTPERQSRRNSATDPTTSFSSTF
jgi:hypothetical protein